MAKSEPRVVEIGDLRFRPANSNDRTRAGMEHAFRDVPACSFARGDGISHYMSSASGIGDHPQTPASHVALHDDIPKIRQVGGGPAPSFGKRLLRSGFGLSVLLHASLALGIGYMTLELPDNSALLEGETVVAVEFFSETESEVTTRVAQDAQDGEETDREIAETTAVEPVEKPVEKVVEEPVAKTPAENAKPVEPLKPVETAEQPEPVKAAEEAVAGSNDQDVLATNQPSSFQVEAAARQILNETQFEPLPTVPNLLVAPPLEQKAEPKLAQPLPHPVSKPRVVEKVAEAKPIEKPVERPVAKKEEPKPVDKKPEPRKEPEKAEPKPEKKVVQKTPDEKPVKKKREARDGNAETNSDKGTREAKNLKGASQDASQGGSKKKVKGNAAYSSYIGLVQSRLNRAKKRVDVGARGRVVVYFRIQTDGSVTKLRLRQKSGRPAVDNAALDVVRKASPFPPFPANSNIRFWEGEVPMTFKGN